MKSKIICIFVMTLFIATVVLPVSSISIDYNFKFKDSDEKLLIDLTGIKINLQDDTDKLDQYMEDIGDTSEATPIGGSYFGWQLFRPSMSVLTRIEVYVNHVGNPGSLDLEILSLSGIIMGNSKASSSYEVPYDGTTNGWVEFDLNPSVIVIPGMLYFIQLKAYGGDPDTENCWMWQANPESMYSRGIGLFCVPEPPYFITLPNMDFAFRTYGRRYSDDFYEVVRISIVGPKNVPGTSIYDYTAKRNGKEVKVDWEVTNGKIVSTSNKNIEKVTIQWEKGPSFGEIKVKDSDKINYLFFPFEYKEEINIVEVKIEETTNSFIIAKKPPFYGGIDKTKENWTLMVCSGDSFDKNIGPGLEWSAKVTLTGPKKGGVEQGLDAIKVGFIQNGKINQKRGLYRTVGKQAISNMETTASIWIFDIDPDAGDIILPYYSRDADAILEGKNDKTKIIKSNDSPRLGAPVSVTHNGVQNPLDEINAEVEFNIYIVASTTDDDFARQTVCAIGNWKFNADGTCELKGTDFVYTRTNAKVVPPTQWDLQDNGEEPPDKGGGTCLLELAQLEKWVTK